MKLRILLASLMLVVFSMLPAQADEAARLAEQAEGDTRPCVTWKEWRNTDFNEVMGHVHNRFDTSGNFVQQWPSGDQTRAYSPCDDTAPKFCIDFWRGSDNQLPYKVWTQDTVPRGTPCA